MSESLKEALSSICNDRVAVCFEPNCSGRIFAHDPSSRCCGHTYAEAAAHYKPIHVKMLQEELDAIKDAHTKYADFTSGPSVGSSFSGNKAISHSVQKLFDDEVYPTYQQDMTPFDNAADEIGDMLDTLDCIANYNAKYEDCKDDVSVTSITDTDPAKQEKLRKTQITSMHKAMNKLIRDKKLDPAGMVAALKAIITKP